MPIYVYKHPEQEEYREVFQGMNDEHVYSEGGVEWQRVFLSPNASVSASIDPFNRQQYIDATYQKKGTVGDMMDLSAELSAKRAEKTGGKDPIKEKFYDNYAKERGGAEHPQRIREQGYESKNVKVDYD
ncbi:MAG TPA: hypothetical protein DEG32_06555 [Balneolaceae bacterium]|nr:hypothetical protein [Balneolaceae bacterium]|tara:strand:- start:73 stop:459 length:387 start_codon:yes stop_codon:yes gene_type:complete